MLALQALTPQRLAAAVPQVSLSEARKLIAQVHRGEAINATSAIRRASADAVRAIGSIPSLELAAETPSAIDPFVKYLFAAPDGARFETVRIPLEHPDRFTVCVSSQVGCALACSFCATGRLGLTRNLAAWEIVEQVRVVRAGLPLRANRANAPSARGTRSVLARGRVHGVVFQGMGEPLANLDAVLAAIEVLTEPCALGIDARAITVCTAGLPVGIRRLATAAPKVRLGLSIHTVVRERRKALMPIARTHDVEDVLAAAVDHAKLTGLAPMWAITLLDGVNDSVADAHALAERARSFAEATGVRPRISIIAYNPIGDDDPYQRSPREAQYREALGLPSHRRYSGGSDVGAACGQLALRS
jgi:23S rRNA (adenine2503-C2)-methyltransferase